MSREKRERQKRGRDRSFLENDLLKDQLESARRERDGYLESMNEARDERDQLRAQLRAGVDDAERISDEAVAAEAAAWKEERDQLQEVVADLERKLDRRTDLEGQLRSSLAFERSRRPAADQLDLAALLGKNLELAERSRSCVWLAQLRNLTRGGLTLVDALAAVALGLSQVHEAQTRDLVTIASSRPVGLTINAPEVNVSSGDPVRCLRCAATGLRVDLCRCDPPKPELTS